MSQTTVLNAGDLICGLKGAITTLECQNNLFLLKQQQHKQEPSIHVIIPVRRAKCPKKSAQQKPEIENNHSLSQKYKDAQKEIRKIDSTENTHCVPAMKIPEMRCGYLYTKCECLLRNGLQDDCPLTGCQGQPQCLVKPWPVCHPGKYYRSLNPDLYPEPNQKSKRKKH